MLFLINLFYFIIKNNIIDCPIEEELYPVLIYSVLDVIFEINSDYKAAVKKMKTD